MGWFARHYPTGKRHYLIIFVPHKQRYEPKSPHSHGRRGNFTAEASEIQRVEGCGGHGACRDGTIFTWVYGTGGGGAGTGRGSRGGEPSCDLVAPSQGTSPVPSFGVTPSPSPCRARWRDALLHSQGNGLAHPRSFLSPF